jgi:hypothetical protein
MAAPRGVVSRFGDVLATRDRIRSGELASELGISRQAAHYHLRALCRAGELVRHGAGRGAHYRLPTGRARLSYPRLGLAEDHACRDLAARLPRILALPVRARDIAEYAASELVANAVAHSGGRRIGVKAELSSRALTLEISDDGCGVFEKIRAALELSSPLDALGRLSKGYVTTDPTQHRGEALAHLAEAADMFELSANGLSYSVDNLRADRAAGKSNIERGTVACVVILARTERRLREIATARDAHLEAQASVRLFSFGTRFVSRAEARRLLDGLERIPRVQLDFSGVESVGFGFADEVFRVWSNAHPSVELEPVHMNEEVAWVIERARSG